MMKKYARGVIPLIGLMLPFMALGFALRKGGFLTKARRLSDAERLIFY